MTRMTYGVAQEIRSAHNEGASTAELAVRFGLSRTYAYEIWSGRKWAGQRVDTAPLRAAVDRSGLSYAEIARRLGWWRPARGAKRPDGSRVCRAIGAYTNTTRGYRYSARSIGYERAVRICEAINIDPVDLGL